MRLLNDILYIEFRDFITAGWKEDTVKKANQRNGATWQMERNPADARMPMVKYETLTIAHQDKLKAHFGDPFEYVAKAPIKALVQKDAKAEAFYLAYRTSEGNPLPDGHIKNYTTAASWLNMLLKLNADKKYIKKTLGLSLETFFANVVEIIKTDGIGLPSTYQRLRSRMAEYTKESYACLISGKFDNKSAAKIGKTNDGFDAELYEKQLALIRKVASMHNNFDAAQVTMVCKPFFDANGWTMVGPERMRQILDEMEYFTTPGARGSKAFNNRMQMHVKRVAPDAPLKYWTLDGWTAELLYQDGTNYSNRLVIVVVLDAYNKYPIGYAIGDRENTDLIRQALRNALLHVNDLMGAYRPWQLQSDNYGVKQLTPFYESCGHLFTPAAVGNAKSKVVEPYFNYLNKTYCQIQYNWSGHNITARQENQPNAEFINKIKKSLPYRAEVEAQLEAIMMAERERKQADLLEAWAEVPETDRCTFTRPDMLMALGQTTGHSNKIGGYGLTPTINGTRYFYDTFDPAFRALTNVEWIPMFDPADLSQILAISKCGKHRFMLDARVNVAMDARSASPEMNEHRAKISAFNKGERERITRQYMEDAEVVEELVNSTPFALTDTQEVNLKLMFTNRFGQQKEGIQDAKGLKRLAAKQAKEDAAISEAVQNTHHMAQMEYLNNRLKMEDYDEL